MINSFFKFIIRLGHKQFMLLVETMTMSQLLLEVRLVMMLLVGKQLMMMRWIPLRTLERFVSVLSSRTLLKIPL